MHIAITGSSGLLGSALAAALTADAHRITRLVRRPPSNSNEVHWDPTTGVTEPSQLDGVDTIIHLAGENIAAGRWTRRRREAIRRSRVDATRALVASLARRPHSPANWLCASAVGFYGDRGAERLTETAAAGTGFLADVCRDWEQAAGGAAEFGARVIHLRLGVVLTCAGGMLRKLLTPFRLGLGGPVGRGTQYVSWIAIDDAVGAVRYILGHAALAGAVNVVAPECVTNAQLAHCLARAVRRPALLRTPAFALRFALGALADELILASTRAAPAVLVQAGYAFRYPHLAGALLHLLA